MVIRHRHLVAAASLLAGVVVLGVMAVIGYQQLTEPFGADPEPTTKSATCPAGEHEVVQRLLRRGQVKVSVYNAGGVKGAAGRTMKALERAGFRPGEVANAPSDVTVARAKVFASAKDQQAAVLVARFLGRGTQVVESDKDYGPGVDVFIGSKQGPVNPRAQKTVRLAEPVHTCVADKGK